MYQGLYLTVILRLLLYMNISKANFTQQEDFGFQGNHISPLKDNNIVNKECRICLEQQNRSNNNPLIAPCSCSGSIKFVHFGCMGKWIQKNHRIPMREITEISKFVCEMCKKKIQFQCQHELICHKWSEFKSIIKQQTCTFIFITLATLISFILACVGIAFLIILSLNTNFVQSPTLLIAICVILASIFCGISIFIWIKQFAVGINSKITRIGAITENSFRIQSHLTTEYLYTEEHRKIQIFTSMKVYPLQTQEQNSILN